MTPQFEPTNEKGVEYLFYRNHEKLGFERVIRIQLFPDVIALRNAVEVGIEIEYNLSGFMYHYIFNRHEYWDWRYENDYWYPYYFDDVPLGKSPEFGTRYNNRVYDKDRRLVVDNVGRLTYKTLKDKCQYIICWNKNCELPEDIDIICLSDKWHQLTNCSEGNDKAPPHAL